MKIYTGNKCNVAGKKVSYSDHNKKYTLNKKIKNNIEQNVHVFLVASEVPVSALLNMVILENS